METRYPHLFSPVDLAGYHLPNRIVHASTSTRYCVEGRVTDRLIAYYVNRARGGAALLVSEPMGMLPWQNTPTRPQVRSGVNDAALVRWAAAVADAGGLMLGQIQDSGRGDHSGFRNFGARGASALPDDLSWTVPQVLTTAEIYDMIAAFAEGSRKLASAGFAGVEISAGHGHLFHQFLAARSNHREDEFGGDLEGRTRLLRLLVKALRSACGAHFIIGMKLPAWDGNAGGVDEEEAGRITEKLAGREGSGIDYLTYCWGSHSETLYKHLPDNHGKRMPYVETIAALGRKAAPGVRLGALGLITDPNEGEKIIRSGMADLVMLARPLIADPAWPLKAREGREAEIRYCVSCNTCWRMITSAKQLACDNNPRLGATEEADWRPGPAAAMRRVVVVGAGVAGMEAAWTAAARGHEVHVFAASQEVGGKVRLHAGLPGGEGLSSIYDYQYLAAKRHGVHLYPAQRATAAAVLALDPDIVLLATGATPAWPAFLPDAWRRDGMIPDIREAVKQLGAYPGRNAGTAVVWDEDHSSFTYDAVELVAGRFEQVILLTPRERIASDQSVVTRQGIYARLYGLGVRIVTSVRPLGTPEIGNGRFVWANVFNGKSEAVDDVVFLTFATARIPDTVLAAPLRAAGKEVRLIGDCKAPRDILSATSEGYHAAMEL